jgi:hypothetical protein
MFSQLVAEMNNSIVINRRNDFNTKQELPSWL